LVSLTQLQEVPPKSLILLVGPPGSGKSTFCQQAILQSLTIDRPVIYMTTEYDQSEAAKKLREIGLGEVTPGVLTFVDAYTKTVGISVHDRPNTVYADCYSLSSIDIAISKVAFMLGKRGGLLIVDSLTSPYLFNGSEVLRFMRQTLSKLAAQGHAVLVCIDEGCSRSEDLVAMMSLASGVIRIEVKEDKQIFSVVKHPVMDHTRKMEVSLVKQEKIWDPKVWDEKKVSEVAFEEGKMRKEIGDYVNLFWPTYSYWSCMLWDPQRFSEMSYEWNKQQGFSIKIELGILPFYMKILFKLFAPKSLSKVKDVKKFWSRFKRFFPSEKWGLGIIEYLDEASKTDEHHFRVYENFECWGFDDVGTTMASYFPPMFAGMSKGISSVQGLERECNAIETKCIGLGDPYCEFKFVNGEIDGLQASLHKPRSVLEKIHEGLTQRLMGFLLEGKPLVSRPRLGSDVDFRCAFYLAASGERYQMALRLGGARAGKNVGKCLMAAGLGEDEAVERILYLLNYLKIGKVTLDELVRIEGNCESLVMNLMTAKQKEPQCCFTTGFLNGFFSAVKNLHVKETKCVGMGDPFCEWEFI
jgi:predicted hydrocarbon binding protein/KaiC/GvpD/RAD55 family RecA-like ATPase